MRRIPKEELIEICGRINGKCGLYVYAPGTEEEEFSYNADEQFLAASTIKIPLLAALLKKVEEENIDLREKRVVNAENRGGGSGILQSLSPDLQLSIMDIAVLMMSLSDNIATNEIIDIVGFNKVAEFCKEYGLTKTALLRKLQLKSIEGLPPVNVTSVNDLARILRLAMDSKLVSEYVSRMLLQIMAGQRLKKFTTALPVSFQADPYAEITPPKPGRLKVSAKGGTLSENACHDAAVFYLPDGRYYIMVMMTAPKNNPETTRHMSDAAIAMYKAML